MVLYKVWILFNCCMEGDTMSNATNMKTKKYTCYFPRTDSACCSADAAPARVSEALRGTDTVWVWHVNSCDAWPIWPTRQNTHHLLILYCNRAGKRHSPTPINDGRNSISIYIHQNNSPLPAYSVFVLDRVILATDVRLQAALYPVSCNDYHPR
jgi:hypothetical protein